MGAPGERDTEPAARDPRPEAAATASRGPLGGAGGRIQRLAHRHTGLRASGRCPFPSVLAESFVFGRVVHSDTSVVYSFWAGYVLLTERRSLLSEYNPLRWRPLFFHRIVHYFSVECVVKFIIFRWNGSLWWGLSFIHFVK